MSEENIKVTFVCDCGEKFDCWKCYEDHIFEVHGQVPVWTEQLKHQHILCEHHQGSPRAADGSVIS